MHVASIVRELTNNLAQLNGADPILKTSPSEYFVSKFHELVTQHGEQVHQHLQSTLKPVVASFVSELLMQKRAK